MGEARSGRTDNQLSGSSRDTVQAGAISGGIHFHHGPAPDNPAGITPRQLPRDVPGFVNRTEELRRLHTILTSGTDDTDDSVVVAVCVIAGTAGAGKTSLALRWAHQVRNEFPDGQLYVNLRGYDPGEPVTAQDALHRFLTALGVPAAGVPSETDSAAALFRSLLADRRVLVVLDNAASVAQVRPLLPGHAGCLVIVTSRGRLSGLAVRDGAHRLTLGTLPEAEAVALLRAVTSGYRAEDDAEKLVALARLCARLPLALRIAAERAASHPHMQLDELIADLRDESALWEALSTGDEQDAEAVRSVFSWSYRALPPDAARLFRLLGLHPGPEFGIGAVAALAGISVRRARHLLDVLVGAHLLEQTAPDRFEFHDLLRAYATDQSRLEETPESRAAAMRRVLDWYLHTADSAQSWIAPAREHVALDPADEAVDPLNFSHYDQAVDWSEREQANLVAAVRAAEKAGLDRYTWQLSAVFWSAQAPSAPVTDWLATGELGLRAAQRLGDRRAAAGLLESLGFAHRRLNHLTEALRSHHEALAMRRELGDVRGEAAALNALGLILLRTRRLGDAEDHFARAISLFRDLGVEHWEAVALANLAEAYVQAGRLTEAADQLDRALAIHQDAGNKRSAGNVLRIQSAVHLERGELCEAFRAANDALDIALELRDHVLEGYWLLCLGAAQRAQGQLAEALTSYQRSAVIHRRLGDRSREALALQGVGETYQRLDRHDEAADFHRRAVAVHEVLGDTWHHAVALDSLASSLRSEDAVQANRCWEDVLRLLSDYRDARAVTMRERIESLLDR
ncbi:tetratricopeptide repeat protein [Streptomyces sioyaensis]|uniref:ATP-binding protein n=1 Tax=Streptomyces sioyaensis TaxID=67364 RepID=UPI00142EDAE2|nr:tetratricopeptide repeat protein [Streptomyces sioyaensis]MBM4794514.1 tetratricopeptide repeat protein [Streptomyces sioyaensis]